MENYIYIAKLPKFRKWVGERVWNNLTSYVQTVFNEKFEDGIEVDRDHIEDDQIGIYNPMVEMLGTAAKQLWDDLIVQALLVGGSTVVYDGQYFFDNDHPIDPSNPSSAVQSNSFTTSALTAANYVANRATMRALVGEDGTPLQVCPDVLMVPTNLEDAGKQVVEAPTLPGGGFNTNYNTAKLIVNPKLPNNGTWYLFDTSKAVKPMVKQVRFAPDFQALDQPNMSHVIEKDVYRYGARARGAAA